MRFDDYKKLKLERAGRRLLITLNRPEQLNAIDGQMHDELARVFYDAALDRESDLIILSGAGRAFCAGGDIGWLQEMIDDPDRFDITAVEAKRIVFSLLECEKPVIAKVNGHAIGLGATLALFCDIIYAADTARIGDPHVGVGFVAGDGGAVIWPQLVGYARAKEFLMTGELIPAPRAAELGLINHAVPPAELDAAVDEFAARLESGARKAIRWTKTAVNIGLRQLAASIMDAGLAYEGLSNRTRDHQEGLAAFRDKRPPKFEGR
jgi:enoyl-CoA hydratase